MYVANSTEANIEVEIDETTIARKAHETGKKFGFGIAPLTGAGNIKVLFAL